MNIMQTCYNITLSVDCISYYLYQLDNLVLGEGVILKCVWDGRF